MSDLYLLGLAQSTYDTALEGFYKCIRLWLCSALQGFDFSCLEYAAESKYCK